MPPAKPSRIWISSMKTWGWLAKHLMTLCTASVIRNCLMRAKSGVGLLKNLEGIGGAYKYSCADSSNVAQLSWWGWSLH